MFFLTQMTENIFNTLAQPFVKTLLVVSMTIGAGTGTAVTTLVNNDTGLAHEARISAIEKQMEAMEQQTAGLLTSLKLLNDELEARSLLSQVAMARLPGDISMAITEVESRVDNRLDRLENTQSRILEKLN